MIFSPFPSLGRSALPSKSYPKASENFHATTYAIQHSCQISHGYHALQMTSDSMLQENAHKTRPPILCSDSGIISNATNRSSKRVLVSMYIEGVCVIVLKTQGLPSLMIMVDAEIITSRPSPEVVFGRRARS